MQKHDVLSVEHWTACQLPVLLLDLHPGCIIVTLSHPHPGGPSLRLILQLHEQALHGYGTVPLIAFHAPQSKDYCEDGMADQKPASAAQTPFMVTEFSKGRSVRVCGNVWKGRPVQQVLFRQFSKGRPDTIYGD